MENLQQYVTSIEMSKKLHEAGFEMESVFCYLKPYNEQRYYLALTKKKKVIEDHNIMDELEDFVSAPTFQEIWKELQKVDLESISMSYQWELIEDQVVISDHDISGIGYADFDFSATSITDSAAKALIWCLKNGFEVP